MGHERVLRILMKKRIDPRLDPEVTHLLNTALAYSPGGAWQSLPCQIGNLYDELPKERQ
jgi:hypothetical protein